MNQKQSKKLRKFLREQFTQSNEQFSLRDEVIQHNFELQKQLNEKQKEINALCEIIKTMNEQMQKEAKKEYEEMPEVLK